MTELPTTPQTGHPSSKPCEAPGSEARRRHSGSRGLTTLEWLLIVAAVAGIAALAVVLVQNVVSDTAEQISGSSARRTAAELAGDQVANDSRRPKNDQPNINTWREWKRFYDARCNRLAITYSDTGLIFTPTFTPPNLVDDLPDSGGGELPPDATTCKPSGSS